MSTSLLIMIFGFVILGFGLWDYLGRGTHTTARRLFIFIWLVYAEIPIGLCFSLIGLGAVIARRPVSDALMVAGLLFGAIGLLLIFWHPKWLRPTWLRGSLGD